MRTDCGVIISLIHLLILFQSKSIHSQSYPPNRYNTYDDYLRNNAQYSYNTGANTRVIPQGNDNKYPGYFPPGYVPPGYNPADPNYDRNKLFDPNYPRTQFVSI